MDYRNMQDRYFSSSLGRLHYKHSEIDSEYTIVLLHGFAASSLSWSRFIEHLPESMDIIALDLLGHGMSEAPDIEYTIPNQSKAIEELLSSLNLKHIVLIGHSYGGWIAAAIAIRGSCDYLILEDSAGMDEFDDERLAADPEFRETLIKQALMTNPNERVLRSILYSRQDADYLTCDRLSTIKMPALIIWGGDDLMIPVKFAQAFNSCIKNSELFILAYAKHTPHHTNPQEIADKVLSFLARSKNIL